MRGPFEGAFRPIEGQKIAFDGLERALKVPVIAGKRSQSACAVCAPPDIGTPHVSKVRMLNNFKLSTCVFSILRKIYSVVWGIFIR